ncbi:hypothetical protein ACLK19_00405 [Escherichia coli]
MGPAVVNEAHHLVWSEDAPSRDIRPLNNWQSTCRAFCCDRDPGTAGDESHFARLRLLDRTVSTILRSPLKSRKIIVRVADAVAMLLAG